MKNTFFAILSLLFCVNSLYPAFSYSDKLILNNAKNISINKDSQLSSTSLELPSPSFDWIPLGKEWSNEEREIVNYALGYIHENMGDKNVRQCVRDRTVHYTGNYAPKDKLVDQAWKDYDALSAHDNDGLFTDRWPIINISGEHSSGWWGGRAFLELNLQGVEITNTNGDAFSYLGLSLKKPIQIKLNLRFIQDNLKANKKALVQQVAGIILHEILHQMGHSHPTDNSNGDYQKDYQQGHFIVIAGDCLASEGRWARSLSPNGQYSDGIGDSSGRIDMSQWKLD